MESMHKGRSGAGTDSVLRLNELLRLAGETEVAPELAGRFRAYLHLLMRWNARLNLTAIRDAEGILARHFLESIVCARAVPEGVGSLLDFGSGAGFPGIPIALCRPEVAVTLAESQGKKAAFLREVLRTLDVRATVSAQRAESLELKFDCVVLRAVDRMERAVVAGAELVGLRGWLILMATGRELSWLREAAGTGFVWEREVKLPLSEDGVIARGARER